MKLTDIQKKSQYLADNYEFKSFIVNMKDVTHLEIYNDPFSDKSHLKVNFRVLKNEINT